MAAFVVLAPLAISLATQRQTLSCDRQTGLCRYETTNLVGERRTISFLIADVSEVRLVPGTGKQQGNARCVLVFRSGRDFSLPSTTSADAQAEHAELSSFFTAGGNPTVHHEHEAGPTAKLGMIFVAMLVGAFALAALGKMLPMRVRLAGERIWIPRKKRSFDSSQATKVAVETHPENDKLRRVAVFSGEQVEFLLRDGRAGAGPHQRVARKLGELLSVPVDLGPDPEAPQWKLPKLPRAIPLGWKLFGAFILLTIVVSSAVSWFGARSQGTLEVECKGRCRFENMECLPGGSVTMGLSPGTYTIETWAPDSATKWKANEVVVELGRTRKFVCPPSR